VDLYNENTFLRNQIKQLELDRKYEDDRLKNATLNLELEIKVKNCQIERLIHQLNVY
jgi:hypothetical protein